MRFVREMLRLHHEAGLSQRQIARALQLSQGAAQESFLEAVDKHTSAERKDQLRQQLLAYCKLDTYAMVKLWEAFSGNVMPNRI